MLLLLIRMMSKTIAIVDLQSMSVNVSDCVNVIEGGPGKDSMQPQQRLEKSFFSDSGFET